MPLVTIVAPRAIRLDRQAGARCQPRLPRESGTWQEVHTEGRTRIGSLAALPGTVPRQAKATGPKKFLNPRGAWWGLKGFPRTRSEGETPAEGGSVLHRFDRMLDPAGRPVYMYAVPEWYTASEWACSHGRRTEPTCGDAPQSTRTVSCSRGTGRTGQCLPGHGKSVWATGTWA